MHFGKYTSSLDHWYLHHYPCIYITSRVFTPLQTTQGIYPHLHPIEYCEKHMGVFTPLLHPCQTPPKPYGAIVISTKALDIFHAIGEKGNRLDSKATHALNAFAFLDQILRHAFEGQHACLQKPFASIRKPRTKSRPRFPDWRDKAMFVMMCLASQPKCRPLLP